VSNLHEPQPKDHVKRIAQFAQDAIQEANDTLVDEEDPSLGHISLRIGFHSGPCVSNVVVSWHTQIQT
jgi:class 3 adenylate cyclase